MKLDYLKPLEEEIDRRLRLLPEGERLVIAIDGHAASGKTTAGDYLSERWQGNVIHMDDFFLPFAMRTPERMETPGANIHWERFLEEVWKPLSEGKAFEYRRFDCGRGDYGACRRFMPASVNIIEGAYSMRPGYIKYDISVFFESDGEIQLDRVLKRSGPGKLAEFQNRFIPMENRYIELYDIKGHADFSFDTSALF
ncbi:MAG: uridine kinase [Lachnospiraceae bacterium]|nr:uridine kinase [Lachnospiraceae bacterium]